MQLSDLWSCGIILYTMVFGRLPFDAGDKQHARKVVAGDYDIPENPGVSAECVILIQQLLEPNPQKRIALQEVMAKPWFQTDLPPGCLTMNEFYCAFSKSLDQVSIKKPILSNHSVQHWALLQFTWLVHCIIGVQAVWNKHQPAVFTVGIGECTTVYVCLHVQGNLDSITKHQVHA